MAVIGIDLGGTNVNVGVVEKQGLRQSKVTPINAQGTQDEVISEIIAAIDQVFDDSTEAIGIGVPAIVDTETGTVYEVVNIPSWKEVPLKDILEAKYDVPVIVNNDANCFALAEKYFGKGKGLDHVVGLIIGTGMGAGIIVNGHLHSGRNCGAGEFGEIIYKDHNLEYYCSGQFFQEEFGLSGEEVAESASKGDKEALERFSQFGYHLGKALSVVVHSVDPEIIILGGSVSKSFRYFEESMRKSLKESIYGKSYDNLKIEVSEIPDIALLGAAGLYYDSLEN